MRLKVTKDIKLLLNDVEVPDVFWKEAGALDCRVVRYNGDLVVKEKSVPQAKKLLRKIENYWEHSSVSNEKRIRPTTIIKS